MTTTSNQLWTRKWSDLELSRAAATYQETHPEAWRSYLQFESERGFITNAMNDHIKAHLELLFPGLAWKDYGAGVVAFRFANEHAFHFPMWQPENRSRRWGGYWAYVREAKPPLRGNLHSNGTAAWSAEQIAQLMIYLQEKTPEFWAKMCEAFDKLGFSDSGMLFDFSRHVAAIFPVPEDVDYSRAFGPVITKADRLYQFEMMKPENKELSHRFWHAWDSNPAYETFDEWRKTVTTSRTPSESVNFLIERRKFLLDAVKGMPAQYPICQEDVSELMLDCGDPGEAALVGALAEIVHRWLPRREHGKDENCVDTQGASAGEGAVIALARYGLMEFVTARLGRWTPAGKRFLVEHMQY